MKQIYLLLLLLLAVAFSCDKTIISFSEEPLEKLPADFMFDQRAYPTGQIKTDAYRKAIQWKKAQRQERSLPGTNWEFVGPVNIGGRITDIEIPSNNGQTYYVGAASGGIFKTTNAGATWTSIFDEQEMLSIGDIAISSNNNDLVWVGTGEVNAGGGSLVYDGDGMYFSTNAGQTWTAKGLADVGSISKIVIDPNDDNTIFVGAMGPLFRNDNNRGVYRSTNGGTSWEQKLFVSDSTGIIDMAIHPSNGNIVYACSWERIRRPNYRQYGGETSGIYRSTDGGDTWSELTNGLPSAASEKGRISIDISQSNPNVLFARYCDSDGAIEGVFKTTDGGNNWTEVNSSQLTNIGFHWWFGGIFIDPADENILYNVDFIVEKSIDGGNNWFETFPNVHVDQHALAFNTLVTGEVLLGNDGGFYKSSNDGASWTKDEALPITQMYRMHVDAQNENKIYAGAQDNSTMRTTTGGLNNWNIITGGDGFQPLVDPTNTSVIYALSQRGNLVKSVNDGLSFAPATNGISNGDRKNWDTPIVFDPQNSQRLYYGANRVYKTEDAAGFWTAISPDLSNGPYPGNLTFGTVTSIDVSPLDSNKIFAGTDDGNVWFTNDGGGNWDLISAGLPNRWVTKVLASREFSNGVYVTYSGYRYGEDEGHVYRSIDAGLNWLDISVNLPDIPVNDIVQDVNDNLYVATDAGVFATATQGAVWEEVGNGLPSVVVTDMHISEGSQYLYAATYGRSIYKTDISDIVLASENPLLTTEVAVYPNPVSALLYVRLPEGINAATIGLFDTQGKEIKKGYISGGTTQLNVQGLRSGLYFLRISTDRKQLVKKVIVN
jgi:photosystem II stability/assembly factor-like uncharacterized protein